MFPPKNLACKGLNPGMCSASATLGLYTISCHIGLRYNVAELYIDGLVQDCSISIANELRILSHWYVVFNK